MLIFQADKDSEIDYGVKGYCNTESRACTNKSLTSEGKTYLGFKFLKQFKRKISEFDNLIKENKKKGKGVQHWEQQGSLGDE